MMKLGTEKKLLKECPHCHRKNVSAGHVLGHFGKGHKKMFSADHLQFLSLRMSRLNETRKLEISKRRRVNEKKCWSTRKGRKGRIS